MNARSLESEADDEARFARWLRVEKGIDDPRDVGADYEWLREEFEEWCRDGEDERE